MTIMILRAFLPGRPLRVLGLALLVMVGPAHAAGPVPSCQELYATPRLGSQPWRDAPSADVAREAERWCWPRTHPGTPASGAAPAVPGPVFDPADPATAALIARLASRIDGWRAGPAAWFPADGASAPALPRVEGFRFDCLRPEYPARALRTGASGVSRVGIDVDASGALVDIVLLRAAGPSREHGLLDRAVVESLAACTLPPAPGVPRRRAELEYVWRIVDETPPPR